MFKKIDLLWKEYLKRLIKFNYFLLFVPKFILKNN